MNSQKEYKRLWYIKNKKRVLEKAKENYEKNRPRRLKYIKQWAKVNPGKCAGYVARYQKSPKGKVVREKYRIKTIGMNNLASQGWAKRNPEKRKLAARKWQLKKNHGHLWDLMLEVNNVQRLIKEKKSGKYIGQK